MSESTFSPSEKARAIFKTMNVAAGDALMERFFDLWEAENDAHRAGSMAAHAYIRNGARIAIFGSQCAGHEPQLEMWLAACEEAFHAGIKDVAAAFEIDNNNPSTTALSGPVTP